VPPGGHLTNGHSITILAQTFAAILVLGSSLAQAWLWISLLDLVGDQLRGNGGVSNGLHGDQLVLCLQVGGRSSGDVRGASQDLGALRLPVQPALRAGQVHGQDRGATPRAFFVGTVRVVNKSTEQHGGGGATLQHLARARLARRARRGRCQRRKRRGQHPAQAIV